MVNQEYGDRSGAAAAQWSTPAHAEADQEEAPSQVTLACGAPDGLSVDAILAYAQPSLGAGERRWLRRSSQFYA